MLSQLERDLISMRIIEALKTKRSLEKGQLQSSLYDSKQKEISEYPKKQIPIATISKLISVGKQRSLLNYINSRRLKEKGF
jgi:hypothetical protein